MREIKIRGFAFEEMVNDQWQYGTGIHRTVFAEHFAKEVGQSGETFIWTESGWVQIVEGSQGQFTGLKDKNGREIYEGDIVSLQNEFANWKGSVVFDEGAFKLAINRSYGNSLINFSKTDVFEDMGARTILNNVYEVIGNIYENPELLEVK